MDMGSDYSLGIIHEFTVTTQESLMKEEWEKALNDRLDLSLFDLEFSDSEVKGKLNPTIFSENIADFYNILRKILGSRRNGNIDYYEDSYGTELENYQSWYTSLQFEDGAGRSIKLKASFVLLFVEGKVMVEEFYTEPVLMNWLFRNSNIPNKLAGCVISDIVG